MRDPRPLSTLHGKFKARTRSVLWLVLVPPLRLRAHRRLRRLRAGQVTIVTVNWNSCQYLRALLRIVRRRTRREVQILVVDNGSSDGSRALLAREPNMRAVRLPFNLGHDLALDIGFLLVDTEYVVALDVDAIPLHERWLKELLQPLSTGSEIS